MQVSVDTLYSALVGEAFSRRRMIIGVFVGINLAMLAVAVIWPKGYSAAATILIDDKNIIQPLMQGAAVATDVVDRSKMVREFIHSRRVMQEVMQQGGWLGASPSPEDQDRLMQKLIRKIAVTNLGKNLIKIEFTDDDAERAYKIAQRMAELVIHENVQAKAEESQAAYEFIDKQTKEYQQKLQQAELELKEFRSDNLDALPGTQGDISARLNALQERIRQSNVELREAEIRKKSLEKQLSGEAEVATVVSREGQYRQRIAELQAQLDQLRLSYHETYPDVVRLRHQIADLNEAVAAEQARRKEAQAKGGRVELDEATINSPLYLQLRREVVLTTTQIDTLRARIAEAREQLQTELDRGRRVHGGEATLAELSRDYQVNREIYQDLLKRREQARVSMNLDRDKQGLTFRIYEPATVPLRPVGIRYIHILLAGILLSVAVPVGLLYVGLQLDPRIRFASVLQANANVPVITVVPHLWGPSEMDDVKRDLRSALMAVGGVGFVVVIVSALRLARII